MIVVDRYNHHVGIYDKNWIRGKPGEMIGDNVFKLNIPYPTLKKKQYYVNVCRKNGVYYILIKDGSSKTVIKTDKQDEVKMILNSVKAKRVVFNKANKEEKPKDSPSEEPVNADIFSEDGAKSCANFFTAYMAGNTFLNTKGDKSDAANTVDDSNKPDDTDNTEKAARVILVIPAAVAGAGIAAGAVNASDNIAAAADIAATGTDNTGNGTGDDIDSKDDMTSIFDSQASGFKEKYRYKFYLDANHYIVFNDQKGQIHPHTWEIAVEITSRDSREIIKFSELEAIINEILKPYQMNCMNDIIPFDKENPSTENIGQYFKKQIESRISEIGWDVVTLIISESANRSYII